MLLRHPRKVLHAVMMQDCRIIRCKLHRDADAIVLNNYLLVWWKLRMLGNIIMAAQ